CMLYLPRVDDDTKSYYTGLLARIYAETGANELADKYYLETIALMVKLYGNDYYELGLEYSTYASFLISTGQLEQVLYYNSLAEKITLAYFTEKSLEYSDVMLNQGDYYYLRSTKVNGIDDFRLKRGENLRRALDYYQRAVVAGTTGFPDSDPFANPDPSQAISEIQLLQILKKKSRCLEALGTLHLLSGNKQEAGLNFQNALESIKLSVRLIHLIRTGFVSEESRLVLTESEESVFPEATGLCLKLHKLSGEESYAREAFRFAERGRSASFLAAVTDSRARKFAGLPDSLISREQLLRLNISGYRERFFREKQEDQPDSARMALYQSRLFEYTDSYVRLVRYLEQHYPEYYALKYNQQVIDAGSVRNRLSRREALVEYLLERPEEEKPGRLFTFVVTRAGFRAKETAIDRGFMNDIEVCHRFLTDPAYLYTNEEDFRSYVTSAYRLQTILLGDLNTELKGKRLIVVPDDELAYLPFDALLASPADNLPMNFRELPYLVYDFPFSYSYSATLLFDYFSGEHRAEKGLLAFAPDYQGDDRGINLPPGRLIPLPFARQEVDNVSRYVQADVYAGTDAQEKRFRELAEGYDILHLATHTVINDSLPLLSGLAFAKPEAGDEEDGWLITEEIYGMELNARMAVLSACNTGSGRLRKGEGVMSLARGFLYAGCPSIVMTLWEVDDESGSRIMRNFYRLLSAGKNKDEALQLAKLAHIAKADPLKSHPHYWLAYVAVGNTQALFTSRDIYLVVIVFILILILTVDQLYRRQKKTGKEEYEIR
ncbi:MAG: CHAT domain-containing protein, partial [Mangrovibacterium sp.]